MPLAATGVIGGEGSGDGIGDDTGDGESMTGVDGGVMDAKESVSEGDTDRGDTGAEESGESPGPEFLPARDV